MHRALPAGLTVLERGWLSANAIVLTGGAGAAVVDTGYHTHAAHTVALVRSALDGQPLHTIANTHLHSDHCGGNAALQAAWPAARTLIPPGQAAHVAHWNPHALSYTPTGQHCPPFRHNALLQPGDAVALGALRWQVHAAPGHDPHAVLLFEPASRTLISADALWHSGFGVVFPELDGDDAFDQVAATLDVIERLQPAVVIPGHGPVFCDAPRALAAARRRLDGFVRDPLRHAHYAAKVLLKYKLLEWQSIAWADLHAWADATPLFGQLHTRYFSAQPQRAWVESLAHDLARSGAARLQADGVGNV